MVTGLAPALALAPAPAICLALALAPILPSPSAAQDRPLTADMTEVYRTGGVNAPEWALFGPAASLQAGFDGAGNLVVLDAFNKRVVVVGPDGQLVRVVGREGEGPGEFQEVRAIAVWRDGRFAVPDTEHSAVQVFSPDGELERFVRSAGEARTLSTAVRHREIRADPLGDRIIARGVEGVLVEMRDFMNRLMTYPEEDTEGVDDRALEALDLSGDVIASEPVLQGWRAPRPEPPSSTEPGGLAEDRRGRGGPVLRAGVALGRAARRHHRLFRLHGVRDQARLSRWIGDRRADAPALAGGGVGTDPAGNDRLPPPAS